MNDRQIRDRLGKGVVIMFFISLATLPHLHASLDEVQPHGVGCYAMADGDLGEGPALAVELSGSGDVAWSERRWPGVDAAGL